MSKTDSTKQLLGHGLDITGRLVNYWGDLWEVTGKNYLGDWDVVKVEHRPSGSVKVTCSIDPYELPTDHPHRAELVLVS